MNGSSVSNHKLTKLALIRIIMAILVFMLIFFLPAGTFRYWEAWVYIVVLVGLVFIALFYTLKKDPVLLRRRLQTQEKRTEQSLVIKISLLLSLLTFILPGFDHRFGWSNIPAVIVILADLLVIAGYVFIVFVLRENSYAARTVTVEEGQKVISTGPYSLVRHPMYLGYIVFFVMSPIALGSWWAVLPALLVIPLMVFRLLNEETVLSRELDGYQDYMKKTRYHLLPGIW